MTEFSYYPQRAATRGLKYDGEPEDIASLVSYLASKEAHFITGKYSSSFNLASR